MTLDKKVKSTEMNDKKQCVGVAFFSGSSILKIVMNRYSKNVERGIILKYHFIYRRISSYLCDYPIVFNSEGFKHLIYSNNKRRPLKDIRHRVSFIPLIPRILEVCPEPVEIRGQKEKRGDQVIPVRYYAYETSTNEGRIRLITRQKFDETPRFLSLIEIR